MAVLHSCGSLSLGGWKITGIVSLALLTLASSGCAAPRDPGADFELLLARAEAGRSSAQKELAYRYMTGRGVAVDQRQAVRWYNAAAIQCDPDAVDALADLGIAASSCGVKASGLCCPGTPCWSSIELGGPGKNK